MARCVVPSCLGDGPRMSFFGPNAWTWPPATIMTLSAAARALGRWAMTIAMPPLSLTPASAAVSAASPSASRLEFGSSRSTRKGSP
ncbi:conserved hypothetical protein [Ricinus communis]|uniref:Uncharacterized protein n=1 Tax=Ricinus communis TaxID=3988 RepID=B9TKX9_RICCO|nr:conserved hypothetical protein [Ricinus communis]